MAIVIFTTFLGFLSLGTGCGVARRATYPPITAITNARVWNGTGFGQKGTAVFLAGGIISNAPAVGATIIDAQGGYLLPGFIDAHCHVQNCPDLTLLRQYGVTTAPDMGTFLYSSVAACRAPGVTSV
jgi:predicted amidohydrolase YtcJ